MKSIEYVGFIAGSLGVCTFLPEIIKSYNFKVVNLSYISMFISLLSAFLWIIYHYYKDNISGLVTTLLYAFVMTSHLIQKIYYQIKNKKNNLHSYQQPIMSAHDLDNV